MERYKKQKTHPGTLFLWCSVVCTVATKVQLL
jgi:hypothetical protein